MNTIYSVVKRLANILNKLLEQQIYDNLNLI